MGEGTQAGAMGPLSHGERDRVRDNRIRPATGRPHLLGIVLATAFATSAYAELGAYSCTGDTEFSCSAEVCKRLDGPPNDVEIHLDTGAMFLCLYTFCAAAPVEVFALDGGRCNGQAPAARPWTPVEQRCA